MKKVFFILVLGLLVLTACSPRYEYESGEVSYEGMPCSKYEDCRSVQCTPSSGGYERYPFCDDDVGECYCDI